MKNLLLAALASAVFAAPAFAADHEIKMLNFGEDGGMVFEPAFLAVAPGDTVTFIPENSGHWVRGEIQPEGSEALLSEINQPYTVTLNTEGVYVYSCPPHLMMSMVGVIQVGAATNLDQIAAETPDFARRLRQNSDRLQSYLDQVQ